MENKKIEITITEEVFNGKDTNGKDVNVKYNSYGYVWHNPITDNDEVIKFKPATDKDKVLLNMIFPCSKE